MPGPRVLVLFNEPTLPANHPDAESEHDVVVLADVVVKTLAPAGAVVGRLGVVDSPEAVLAGVRGFNPDVVFNLYEGTAKWGNAEAYVAGILELLRVPYTGSGPQAMILARSKPLTKALLAGAGIPTAPYFVVDDNAIPANPLGWPVIVKPAAEDASVGIDQNSVCTTDAALTERVRHLRKTYGPAVVVERLIVGRELHAAVIETPAGLVALPFTEIFFPPPADRRPFWPIVTYDAKWRDGTRDYVATPYKNPADVDPTLERAVADLAKRAFRLVGCRDYARIDFRVDESGNPFVLEVNPNPCIAPGAGVAESLASARISYSTFLIDLVREALGRAGRAGVAAGFGASEPAGDGIRPVPA
jgi:D-alanine-D-alanine ligase